jgi:cytochrome c peroxidase
MSTTVLVVALSVSACTRGNQAPRSVSVPPPAPEVASTVDLSVEGPLVAEVLLGERLFFETRFAQYFFARCNGDVNAELADGGDPTVEYVEAVSGTALDGPFRGQSMNCRHCHLGDDFLPEDSLSGRTYCDFSRRTAIPAREDGVTRTPRNSPLMIDLGIRREVPLLLHLDGEFVTHEDLVIDTLTGRNLGWLPTEVGLAKTHAANVMRNDEGVNPRHLTYPDHKGIPYRVAMLGTDERVPEHLRIPGGYRLDVTKASEDEILYAVGKLMHAYMSSLEFGTANTGRETASPYDLFLEKNRLPKEPAKGETALAYAERLRRLIEERENLQWVTPADGVLELHTQDLAFGETELEGFKIFLARPGAGGTQTVGNCVTCHTPPRFTDYSLHNNGVSQIEYDGIFGEGAFAALEVPDLMARNASFDTYLPPSAKHPHASGRFRAAPSPDKPGHADLGVWNVFGNPDMPKPQAALTQILCKRPELAGANCTPERILPLTIGCFKTPAIRDLGQSYPYFHSGHVDTVEDALRFYVQTSGMAREGKLRNASPELLHVQIADADVAPLAAFLRSLNEDYH